MARPFRLPDLGEGLSEAAIVGVLVREGDVIREDAPLLEVETDKARVEIPSPMSGRVEKIHVQPGQTVKVGTTLITFADEGEGGIAPPPAAATARPGTDVRSPLARDGAPVAATPATRRLARELGVDLRTVRGTGPAPPPRRPPPRSLRGRPPSRSRPRPWPSSLPRCPDSSNGGRSSARRSPICDGPSRSAWRSRPP
jgi:pyruvate dehydrogenase E2 component (dihydrolipoamide acetyltransferase)